MEVLSLAKCPPVSRSLVGYCDWHGHRACRRAAAPPAREWRLSAGGARGSDPEQHRRPGLHRGTDDEATLRRARGVGSDPRSSGKSSLSTTARPTGRMANSSGCTRRSTMFASFRFRRNFGKSARVGCRLRAGPRRSDRDDRFCDPPGRSGRDQEPARQARRGLRSRLGLEKTSRQDSLGATPVLLESTTVLPPGSRVSGSTT